MGQIQTVRANSRARAKAAVFTTAPAAGTSGAGYFGEWQKLRVKAKGYKGLAQDSTATPRDKSEELVLETLLINRDISDATAKERFLNPKYEHIRHFGGAKEIFGLTRACNLLAEHIKQKELILIFGDYDVDGVCSAALMDEAISLVGGKTLVMLPHRESDGYGLQLAAVEKIVELAPGLVVTVDNGSSSHDAINKLKEKGIATIVVDHHQIGESLPEAEVILNPKQTAEQTGFRDLCATGVAFRLAERLYDYFKIKDGQEKWLLDLVGIASVCDMVPLGQDNRDLVFFGLKTLSRTRRPGFKWLLRRAAGDKSLTSETIGFGIGPRLNAAGRLESAQSAFDLVAAPNLDAAEKSGQVLEELNRKRQALTKKVYEQANAQAVAQKKQNSLVLVDAGWPRGVCGLVAGRLAEKYNKPVFVLEECEPAVGSGRSVTGFDLAGALAEMSELFVRAGGHAMAAGCTINTKNIESFKSELVEKVEAARGKVVPAKIFKYELDLKLADINTSFLSMQKRLEPFGVANSRPVVRIDKCQIMEVRAVGRDKTHLSLRLEQGGTNRRAIVFGKARDLSDLRVGEQINVLAFVKENNWQGIKSAQLELIDIMRV